MGRGDAAIRGVIVISLMTVVALPAMNGTPAVAAPPAPTAAVDCKLHPGWWKCKWWYKAFSRQKSTMDSIGFDVVAHLASVAPAPPDMSPPSDSCADTTTAGTEPSEITGSSGREATVTFQKGDDGPTVSETLTEIGDEAATVAVAQLKEILERCPVTEDDTFRTTLSPWKSPNVGDASVGYTIVIESKTPGQPSVRFRTALIAENDVLAHFTMADGDAGDAAQFKDIVRSCAVNLGDTGYSPRDVAPPVETPPVDGPMPPR
jgi:hypothetical protein